MKKLLSLLLVVALVLGLFGTVGTAFAAPVFPDIAGNANEKDIVKLFTLGVIGGYADGTFKPEGNITRAEFAKIAVLALGKGGSAALLKNTASQFKDVPAGQWYTGYINVAVANGIIKGYADGTFKPEANISQAEAATMILRAMGYNDNLPGTWPLNYVMKAADLAIINDTFVSEALSTRSFVCDAVVAMLGYGKVTYTKDTNVFSDPAVIALLTSDTVKSYSATANEITFDDDSKLAVAADVKVATGETLSNLANKTIAYMKKTVDGVAQISYIEVKTGVVAGKVASIDAVNNTATLTNGTVIKLASPCEIKLNGAAATLIALKDSDVTALLDSNGKAFNISGFQLSITGKITAKTTTVNSGVTKITFQLDADAAKIYTVLSTSTIVRNGAVATFADLKSGDDIKMSADADKNAVYVDAFAMTKAGVVTSFAVNAANNAVLSVSFADGTTVSVATGVTIAPDAAGLVVGNKLTFTLDRNGKISLAAFTFDNVVNTASGKITAVGSTVTSTGTTWFITLDNGTSYNTITTGTPAVNDATIFVNDAAQAKDISKLAKDQLVVLSLNNAGKVTDAKAYLNGLVTAAVMNANVTASTTYKVNRVASDNATAAAADDIYVTWDIAKGDITAVDAYDWTATALTVKGTTATTNALGVTTYTVNAVTADYALATGFVVYKDGVVSTFDAIKIGDKVSVSNDSKYVEVKTDTTFGVSVADDITYAGGLVITFDDAVKSVKVTVNGADYTATVGNTVTIDAATGLHADLNNAIAAGAVVGILATDYAGNVATLSIVHP